MEPEKSPAQAVAKTNSTNKKTIWIIVLVIAIPLLITCVLGVIALGSAVFLQNRSTIVNEGTVLIVPTSEESPTSTPSIEPTEAIVENNSTKEVVVKLPEVSGLLTLKESMYTSDADRYNYSLLFEYQGEKAIERQSLEIIFLDAEGKQIARDVVYLKYISPNQKRIPVSGVVQNYTSKPASIVVSALNTYEYKGAAINSFALPKLTKFESQGESTYAVIDTTGLDPKVTNYELALYITSADGKLVTIKTYAIYAGSTKQYLFNSSFLAKNDKIEAVFSVYDIKSTY
jgi:hypothetical protein